MKTGYSISILLCSVILLLSEKSYCNDRHDQPVLDSVQISSPDKTISLLLRNRNGELTYRVDFNKVAVVEPSVLGMMVNGKAISQNASIGKVQPYQINQTYAYRGVHSTAVNKCNGARVNINSGSSSFVLEARVYNDGVAFRYIINSNDSVIVEKDNTEFIIPAGTTIWSQSNIKYYEAKYTKKKIEDFKTGELAGPPVTIELAANNGFAAITEGGLTDFAGMSLIVDSVRRFRANLTGNTNRKGRTESPWRIIMVGKDLNTLVNNDIIANVSPAFNKKLFPKGYDTDWIKPGRSVWSWLANNRSVTLDNMKRFSDLAAELGFEYNLVDEGWSNWKDSTRDAWDMMKELVDHSAKKGVKIWVWKAYPDRKGIPGINEEQKRKAFFKRCKELGIAGLKVDFFDNESQEIIRFYQAALKDAAEYQLMLNFHGANKPTGESRTWPNEMTREAIRGMENRPPWAEGNTTLPFTRYLAGHADFTPIHFGNRMGEVSLAHHVATMIVFTSPFLCVGADPEAMLKSPSKEMIKSIPAVWDETVVLPASKIGEMVVYARRKGTTWYLAAMNGLHEPKTITVDLSFLKKEKYDLFLMKDDKNSQENAFYENHNAYSSSSITIELKAEGGFVGRFEKIKKPN